MYIFKFRRATSSQWSKVNSILSAGEPGVEIDTGKFKIGNGISNWNDLDYFLPIKSVPIQAVRSEPLIPGSLPAHVEADAPHPVYDEGPSLDLIYQNAKV